MHTKISQEKPKCKGKPGGIQCQDFVNTVTNLQVQQKAGNSLLFMKTLSVNKTIKLSVCSIPDTCFSCKQQQQEQ
jgi:hypothetical protein